MSERYRRLRFPVRTEDVEQFPAYRVEIEPWKALSPIFASAFERVFFEGQPRVLLLKGAAGTGKTAFCRTLAAQAKERDGDELKEPETQADSSFELEDQFLESPDFLASLGENSSDFNINTIETLEENNLWRMLCGRFSVQLYKVAPEPGWLEALKQFTASCADIPLIVIDDAHTEIILAGLCGIELLAFKKSRSKKAREAELFSSVAQGIADLCEAALGRAVLLLSSQRNDLFDQIERELQSKKPGLCAAIEMPLPGPAEQEAIVRTNINRLNSLSYWCCLDTSAQPERARVWEIFHEKAGYSQCFLAVDDALRSAPRMGRPANRNVITLLALGLTPARARYFLELHGIVATDDYIGEHLSVAYARGGWAAHLLPNMLIEDKAQSERRRKAMLVQSEFGMRLVALDLKGSYALLRPPSALDLGERLLEAIEFFPSGGHESKKHKQVYEALSAELCAATFSEPAFAAFRELFVRRGPREKKEYLNQAIAQRVGPFQKGFARFPSLKPAVIVHEYSPCTISSSPSNSHADLTAALKRAGHSLEIVFVFDGNEADLAGDILQKIEPYAELLGSV